ncbi:hypothetical protein Hanom_Chr17g01591841 [Helianthus anomalus]
MTSRPTSMRSELLFELLHHNKSMPVYMLSYQMETRVRITHKFCFHFFLAFA